MQRVLHIGMSSNYGGIESFVMNYYRAINKEQIQFDFIQNYDTLAYQEEIETMGGKIYKIADFHKHPYVYYLNLRKVMRYYEIVHVHLLSASNLLPVYAAKSIGVKKIVVHAHSTRTIGIVRKVLHRMNYRKLAHLNVIKLACSFEAGKWMYGTSDFVVFKNAINTVKYEFNNIVRERLRKELNIGDKELVCGNVAAIVKEKNQLFLIKMFAELERLYPQSKLCIVGDGELRADLEKLVTELQLSSKVLFLETRNDVDRLYNIFDCFVLPSLFEGLPLTLVEAQANGLKCYVSDGNVSRESQMIQTMEFVSLDKGAKHWADLIANSSNERYRNARDEVVKCNYDIETEVDKLIELYES